MADHLLPSTSALLDADAATRIAHIRAPRWIGHPGASAAHDAMRQLLERPPSLRPRGLLIAGPYHNGKTMIAERFAVARTQPKDVLARMKTPNLGLRLGELDKPVFVLWGLNDEFCPEEPARLFLDACPNVRCITFANCGHWVQVERAAEFNAYSLDFLGHA